MAKIRFLSLPQNQIITFEHFTDENMALKDELLAWYHKNARNLPWRNTSDPYKIWLSEIILQQTRVEQGLPYYQRFTKQFPNLMKLAQASEEEVLRLWQGLGYYSRGRNLLTAARQMIERHNGFPKTYAEIRDLKGVGEYTAAAIASFAYNLPHAVVDGNVYRFYSRLFGINTPIDSTEGKKEFRALADEMLNKEFPALHNQAVMEMGALICKPKPDCENCPFIQQCIAYKEKATAHYPVKSKSTKVRSRYFYYLLMETGKNIIIRKREEKDIWQGLYEFPLIETTHAMEPEELYGLNEWKTMKKNGFQVKHISDSYLHKLSHQHLHARFIHLASVKIKPDKEWKLIPKKDLANYGMPQLIVKYLNETEH